MMIPVRAMDNRAASMEYAIEALDGNPRYDFSAPVQSTGADWGKPRVVR